MNRLSLTRAAATLTLPWLAALAAAAHGCGADPEKPGQGGRSGSGSNAAGAGSGADADDAADAGSTDGGTQGSRGGDDPGTSSNGDGDDPSSREGDGTCEEFSIANKQITPDMLIVLDRSSSMQGDGVDRWNPSVSGIKAITGELDDVIRFGLMAFPGRGSASGRGGGMACAPGTLEVPIALTAAPAIASALDGLSLIQSTPTAATLQAAHATLRGGAGSRYVILVTDGAPNCSNGRASGGQDPAAVAASVAAISAMNSDGIKTYVLGYDTQNDAVLKGALDQMAQAGGTGAAAHRPIEDEAGLVQEFRSIVGMAAVGCEFTLKTPPSDPNFVRVELDGTKLELDAEDGFVLSADYTVLTVQGAACAKLQSTSEQHTLGVTVACERQTPLF